jgi:hypothetical protein
MCTPWYVVPFQVIILRKPFFFFGLLIGFLGLRILFGKHLLLPKKLLEKKIAEKGITPHKSLTLNVSEDILTNTFIRGVFEGDGHIRNTLTSKGYKRFEAGFVTGSERFALQIEKFLIKNDIKCYLYQENKNTYRIRVSEKENLKKAYGSYCRY